MTEQSEEIVQPPEWGERDWCPKCGGGYRSWSFRRHYSRSRMACLSRRCPKGEHLHRSRTCLDCGWSERVVTRTEDDPTGSKEDHRG